MRRAAFILCTSGSFLGCGERPDPIADFRAELDAVEVSDTGVLALAERADVMSATRGLFVEHCASCHTASGVGLIGPNLADDFYLNVRRPQDIFDVISYGRHAKGMPAWEDKLDPAERLVLAAYAASLRGTSESGKKPEGDELPAWETFLSE